MGDGKNDEQIPISIKGGKKGRAAATHNESKGCESNEESPTVAMRDRGTCRVEKGGKKILPRRTAFKKRRRLTDSMGATWRGGKGRVLSTSSPGEKNVQRARAECYFAVQVKSIKSGNYLGGD